MSTRYKTQAKPQFKRATEDQRALYRLLLSNNQHLLSIHGRTLISQLKELRNEGLIMGRACYYAILSGRFFSMNYAIPHYLSYYWGLSVQSLLFEDLRQKDELDKIAKEVKKGEESPFR